MPDAFFLKLFGVPRLLDSAGRLVRFRARKHLAVLIYLVLEATKRPVTRDALVDLLWPDVSEAKGRHSLSQALSAIRIRLGKDALRTVGPGVQLQSTIPTDLDSASIDTDPGNATIIPLESLETWGSASWSHWVDRARARSIRDLNVRLQHEIDAARSSGNNQAVHERAALLYKVDPFCPVAVLALAEERLLQHDRVGATRLLEEHRRRIRAELHCEPGAEVQRLLARIQDDQDESRSDPFVGRVSAIQHEGSGSLVGRKATLASLEAAWGKARTDRFQSCLLTGPDGIGKTAVLRAFATSIAARAFPTLFFACQEMSRGIPFSGISALIYELSHDPGFSAAEPFWLAEASRVAPGLRSRYSGIPRFEPAPSEALRLRVAEAVVHLINAVREGDPFLIALDDIENMDAASCDVLHILNRYLESQAILLVATTCASDAVVPRLEDTDRNTPIRWTETIRIQPFSHHDMRAFLSSLDADSEDKRVRETLVDLAEGNPHFAKILLSDWRSNGQSSLASLVLTKDKRALNRAPPEELKATFTRRHEHLSEDALRTLDVLAVAHRVLTTDEVARLLAISTARAHHASVELLDGGLVRLIQGGLNFTSRLHRTLVYHSMSVETRRYHHQRFAECLIQSAEGADHLAPLTASQHFYQAGLSSEAKNAAYRGAEIAIARGAPQAALAGLESVITHQQTDARLSILQACALNAQGRYREGYTLLANRSLQAQSSTEEAMAALARAEALHRGRLADDGSISAAARDALRCAEASGDESTLIQAMQTCAEVEAELGSSETLGGLGRRAAAIAATTKSTQTRALAQLSQGYCYLMLGDPGSGTALFESSIRLLESLALEPGLERAVNGLGLAYASLGDLKAGVGAFHRATNISNRIGNTSAAANSCSNLGNTHADLGEFKAASRWLQHALNLEAVATNPRRGAQIHLNMANVRMCTGHVGAAAHHIQQAARDACASQLGKLEADVLLFEADLHIMRGHTDEAWELLDKVHELLGGKTDEVLSIEKYERLTLHRAWTENGYSALERQIDKSNGDYTGLPVVKQLELKAFASWLVRQEGGDERIFAGALADVRARGLYGLIAYLKRLGVE